MNLDAPSLRPRLLGSAVAAVTVGLLVTMFLAPVHAGSPAQSVMFDGLHAPAFAFLALVTLWQVNIWFPSDSGLATWYVLGGLVLFAVVLEGTQSVVDRQVSLPDTVANVCGVLAGAAVWMVRRTGAWRTWFWSAVVFCLIGELCTLLTLADRWMAERAMPQLASFERFTERTRWHGIACGTRRSREQVVEGAWSLRLDLRPTGETDSDIQASGAKLVWLPPDWTGWQRLAVNIFVAGDSPLTLIVRVIDANHDWDPLDRYEGQFALAPGAHRLSVPLTEIAAAPTDRTLDLRRITELAIFSRGVAVEQTVYLDDIRLE